MKMKKNWRSLGVPGALSLETANDLNWAMFNLLPAFSLSFWLILYYFEIPWKNQQLLRCSKIFLMYYRQSRIAKILLLLLGNKKGKAPFLILLGSMGNCNEKCILGVLPAEVNWWYVSTRMTLMIFWTSNWPVIRLELVWLSFWSKVESRRYSIQPFMFVKLIAPN